MIKEGRHYGSPFPFPKFYCCKDEYRDSRIYRFDDTICYDIDVDQSDVNKLFGYSYGFHQNQSDRIGFRYNIDLNKVEIVLYSYELGVRIATKHIAYINIGDDVRIELSVKIINETQREVKVTVENVFTKQVEGLSLTLKYKKKCFGYTLGLYFGGNRTAPHDIIIKEEKQ